MKNEQKIIMEECNSEDFFTLIYERGKDENRYQSKLILPGNEDVETLIYNLLCFLKANKFQDWPDCSNLTDLIVKQLPLVKEIH